MTFTEALRLFFTRWKDFKGRSCPKEYWAALVIGFAVSFVYGFVVAFAAAFSEDAAMVLAVLLGIGCLAFVIPGISIVVRRLHDLGFSGWLYLAYIVIYAILGTLDPTGVCTVVLGLGFVIYLCCATGKGDNIYGPNPLNKQAVAAIPEKTSEE